MAAPVREGDLLAGKYRVERVLGEGGMGVVVAARHVALDERVALKFLLPDALENAEAVTRFLREARAAVRIKSEHVARVSDVGQLENGAPYIVMEFLSGTDLSALLRAQGPLACEDAVDFVAQTCEAIAEAHALGIVHRDLKPANLMLVRRSDGSPCIKVLDFGISKALGGGGEALALTKTAAVFGSPLYMSPEQMMSSRDVDTRSDIWSMGTILYELLAGQTPFVAETLPALGVMIATAQPRPLRAFRLDVPAALEDVVARCLVKRRELRFASVGELAQALAPFAPERSRVSIDRASAILREAQSKSGNQPPLSSGPEAAAASAPSTLANWGHTSDTPEARKGSRAAVAIGLAVLVAAGSVGWVLHARDSRRSVVPPPSAAIMVPPAQMAPSAPALSATLEAPRPAAAPAALSPASAATALPPPPSAAPAPFPAPATPAPTASAKHRAPPSAPVAPAHSEPKKSNYDDM